MNEESKEILEEAGIPFETDMKYGDEESFCVLALAFSEGYANWWTGEKLLNMDEATIDEMKKLFQDILNAKYDSPYEQLHAIQEQLNYL